MGNLAKYNTGKSTCKNGELVDKEVYLEYVGCVRDKPSRVYQYRAPDFDNIPDARTYAMLLDSHILDSNIHVSVSVVQTQNHMTFLEWLVTTNATTLVEIKQIQSKCVVVSGI